YVAKNVGVHLRESNESNRIESNRIEWKGKERKRITRMDIAVRSIEIFNRY
ncbi:MAG: hypothetical protein ACI90V_014148, partial [Bacillariaceae sp.]